MSNAAGGPGDLRGFSSLAGGAGGNSGSVREAIFKAGLTAVKNQGAGLQQSIDDLTAGGTKTLDTVQTLQMQFQVGEFSNLVQAVTGIDKAGKDAMAAVARNMQ